MVFLQKVSFCNLIRNNPWLFPACRRKKIVITVTSYINNFNLKLSVFTCTIELKESNKRTPVYILAMPVKNPKCKNYFNRKGTDGFQKD